MQYYGSAPATSRDSKYSEGFARLMAQRKTYAKSRVNRSSRDRAVSCPGGAKRRLARASQRLHRRGPSLVGPTLSVLVLSAALLRILTAAGHRSGATGVRPAGASSGPAPRDVLVLLPQRSGLLPERADVRRGVD